MRLKELTPPNRNRYKNKPHSDYVAAILANNYNRLLAEFSRSKYGNFQSMSYEDIFQETILYVIQDKRAFKMSESAILDHFRYRYKMIRFQIIQDAKLERKTDYNESIQCPTSINQGEETIIQADFNIWKGYGVFFEAFEAYKPHPKRLYTHGIFFEIWNC